MIPSHSTHVVLHPKLFLYLSTILFCVPFFVAVVHLFLFKFHILVQIPLQDLSHIHEKIERLEQLISGNNKLVAKLSESLLQRKAVLASGGGRAGPAGAVRVNSSSANSGSGRDELLPGCRLAEDMEGGATGVQVRWLSHALVHTNGCIHTY